MAVTAGAALVRDLRHAVAGTVTGPDDPAYDAERRAWSLNADQQVKAVVHAADVADIVATVRYAAAQGIAVATQPVGHGATSALNDTILLRTSALDEVSVDPTARRVHVGAGTRWLDLLPELGKHQLVPLAGSSDTTSVVGYSLGGGLSWVGRRYGFAANAVHRFEVVDADGEPRTVDADQDPDLFWALRGGGGDFAIVTGMEVDVFSAATLHGGRMMWSAVRAGDVIPAYQRLTASAPDELTAWLSLMWLPDLPILPEELRGQRVVVVDVMDLDGESDLLTPLRDLGGTMLDSVRPLPVAEYATVSADPRDPSPSVAQGMLLHDCGDGVAGGLLALTEREDVPFVAVQIRHLAGRFATVEPGGGAVDPIEEPFACATVGVAPTPETRAGLRAGFASLASAFGSARSPRLAFNLLGYDDLDVATSFSAATLARLRSLKQERDPRGVIRSNRPVHRLD